MKNKKILEDNKLIAIFMIDKNGKRLKVPGMTYQQDKYDELYVADALDEEDCEMFKYHKSWDWLMPVVKKISEIDRQGPSIKGLGVELYKILSMEIDTEIKYIYLGVVDFIKWYNKNK